MKRRCIDANTAVSEVAYAFSELAVIYPITPASPMAELADELSAKQTPNLFDSVTKVVQMQSEAGAAGALHGAVTCGCLTSTFTCSQGLLLMLPNMYKLAGELLPCVFHVSARSVATHALNIFCDHSDVMACRQTGFIFLASSSVQESADFALIAHLGALKAKIPVLHFFDGFRTSHEYCTVETLDYDEMKSLLDEEDIARFRARALSPDKPIQRGTAQNGDVFFQNREACSPYYLAAPEIIQGTMDKVAQITGRKYRLFDYCGAPDAERVIVLMGSGATVAEETALALQSEGEKVGVVKVRLYRPFYAEAFLQALPPTCRKITVLDRTKEAGAQGEPLYLDVCAALQAKMGQKMQLQGGRYGLGGKEFTPTMCRAVFENMQSDHPKDHFTVGISDDITHNSLDISTPYFPQKTARTECVFYGLGSDGTVGANKNSIKLLGEQDGLFAQGYFYYDSRKSGGVTVSHLRFGHEPIHAPYLIENPDFVACHDKSYLVRYDMLSGIKKGGVFLLNCPWKDLSEFEEKLPAHVKREIAEKQLQFYVIDGTGIAEEVGLRGRSSTVMQAAFFRLHTHVLPYTQAISALKHQLQKTFKNKGEETINRNFAALDKAENALRKIDYPSAWKNAEKGLQSPMRSDDKYFRNFMLPILSLKGNDLPMSAFNADGSVPTATMKHEKHGAPSHIPKWIESNCIQCNQCAFVCPHATIRAFLFDENAPFPDGFSTLTAFGMQDKKFRIQVSPYDCMGCGLCADICPAKEKALVMSPAHELLERESAHWDFAISTATAAQSVFKKETVKGSQFQTPLFEFSYACAGCGETAYIKVLTQLFGEKMLIANATGCSSIYGGSAPSCPYTVNKDGKGPAWANSLFEDNAEFGLGMRLACDVRAQDGRSVWIIGGDGWAYDIGYGGLDHVLASGENVNILVLDSEVYSNTGGQMSKATPKGATARFARGGKRTAKKNLGLMAMTYKNVYVAQVCMGANLQQFLNALTQAETYDGPSLIIAYAPCIAHGYSMTETLRRERLAVDCGYWHLYRFNPLLRAENKPCFVLDSKAPTADFREFLVGENRFRSLLNAQPERAERLFEELKTESQEIYALYKKLADGNL